MKKVILGKAEFRDKVLACWLGKNIGGTLGAPYECKRYVNDLTFYDPLPKESAPNDDLDLQLVWLAMLEDKGLPPRLPLFAEYWRNCLHAYPWNEYGFCMRNMNRGLVPPVSGWFENYFVDEMGSPIRSEIWACLSPANPQKAAAMAWMDSAMDHAGGEGMNGEMFWAALESAAFVIHDPYELIRIGLAMIPPASNISRVIREAVWCRQNKIRWSEARDRIMDIYGNRQPCNAIPNHGFTILGWLYGKDFGDCLCKAVNCALDTDCTGATLGSVLGIIGGTKGIPKKWSDPIGRQIVLHKFTGSCRAPKDLDELTDRTVALAEKYAAAYLPETGFGPRTRLPEKAELKAMLIRNDEAIAALRQDVRSAVALVKDVEIVLHYNGDPVFQPGEKRRLEIEVRKNGAVLNNPRLAITPPAGWKIQKDKASHAADACWITAPAEVADHNSISVAFGSGARAARVSFTVLGPGEANGFPSTRNVERCKVCQGLKGSCICK